MPGAMTMAMLVKQMCATGYQTLDILDGSCKAGMEKAVQKNWGGRQLALAM